MNKSFILALFGTLVLIISMYLFWSKHIKNVITTSVDELELTEENISMILSMTISSKSFFENNEIPYKYTCDGENINPSLNIEGIPERTKTLVLIVDDPDAPSGDWVHWLVWNIKPKDPLIIMENDIPEGAIVGTNDFNNNSYGGPCPPSGVHRYYFKIYALDTSLELPLSTRKSDLLKAMEGHVLEKGELIGTYKKILTDKN